MKCLSYLMILVIAVGCASYSQKEQGETDQQEPSWLHAPDEGCAESELCASGEGATRAEADANAKKAMGSIFETKIESSLIFSKSSFSSKEKYEIQEEITENILERVDQILQGVKIKERYHKNDLFFSLASLNKVKSIKLLTQQIGKLDDELEHLYELRSRIHLKKLNSLFNRRSILNEKLILLGHPGIKSPLSFSDINALKFSDSGANKIFLKSKSEVPQVLNKKIEALFTEIGYMITNKKNAEYYLYVSFEDKKEFLNVKGFEKFTFTVTLEARSSFGKKVGVLSQSEVSNGRNKKDAFIKVRSKLIENIQKNLGKLNLK
ncbi:MAG: LPP20 family lipoprotein [Bacteriovoracaceae bacterium]|nr:LPP20 family lipoprotein [Bacteriovoracaceae bacterium]